MPALRPEMEPAALAAEREKSVAEVRAKLASYPQPIVARFETLLKAAQVAAIVHEDHNLRIDQRLFYHVQRVILEFGGRLAQAGVLDAVHDVFYLTPDELQNGRDVPMKQLVRERKTEMDHFSHLAPPPWTPLFATASAIVTDSGGVLSHSAVFAREYRIPAVVSTGNATTTFKGRKPASHLSPRRRSDDQC